jgi:DNA-binding SARP family transcriptional activator
VIQTPLDVLSNLIIDLIQGDRLDEAEQLCQRLQNEFPHEIDGLERRADIYLARGDKKAAADAYRAAAARAKDRPDLDPEYVMWLDRMATNLEKEAG